MSKPKKILVFPIFFLFFLSCGYTPIFSKKDVNFSIENIKFLGDRDVKEKINQSLSNYRNKPNKVKKVSLIVNSSKKINVASKNSKGEALTNRISIDVSVKIILSENNFFVKSFSKSSTYAVIDKKSEQKLIENKLTENLSSEITLQIIFEILKKTK
ncbi:MAG: hypothetical protein HVK26_02370 [Pelagibacteraceae bacterium]|jgi:hypothetical protein|nr:hypothetical protein [Pelagibacteraceae bacterium]